jgi:hypothetical protein
MRSVFENGVLGRIFRPTAIGRKLQDTGENYVIGN